MNLSEVVEIATLLAIVTGFAFGIAQMRLAYRQRQRREQNVPNMAEWFQWLAERLEAHPAPGKEEGAHISQRHWQP